jgi:hypothetical protein
MPATPTEWQSFMRCRSGKARWKTKMSRAPTLREFQESNFEDTARFLASIFGRNASLWQSWFAHWWRANPAWNESIPRGWLVRSREDGPIAFTNNIPFRYVIEGKPGLCCATGSTSVEAAWRRRHVGKAFSDQPPADLLLLIDPSDRISTLAAPGMSSVERRWQQINYRVIADAAAVPGKIAATAHLPKFVDAVAGRCAAALMLLVTMAAQRSRMLAIHRIDRFQPRDADSIESCLTSDSSTYAWRDARTLAPRLVGYLAMKPRHPHSYTLLECRTRNADVTDPCGSRFRSTAATPPHCREALHGDDRGCHSTHAQHSLHQA